MEFPVLKGCFVICHVLFLCKFLLLEKQLLSFHRMDERTVQELTFILITLSALTDIRGFFQVKHYFPIVVLALLSAEISSSGGVVRKITCIKMLSIPELLSRGHFW